MGAKAGLCLLGLVVLGTGCSVVSTATHVVSSRVKETWEECAERKRNEETAEAAWHKVLCSAKGPAFSDDYARGFHCGFTEHLFRGAINPPPLPPKDYRRARYQTPAGYRAIQDWFAGFRHGAEEARSGGYRDCFTGPSALRHPDVGPPTAPGECAPGGEKQWHLRFEWPLPESSFELVW